MRWPTAWPNFLERGTLGLVGTALLIAGVIIWAVPGQPDAASASHHAGHQQHFDDSAHETDQGLVLVSNLNQETVTAGLTCPADAPVRAYSVAAITVEMTLNRFLDYDPEGRMYVLEDDLPRVRQEEAANRAARAGQGEPAVSIGQQGDAIQPLTLRMGQGECLRIAVRNALGDGA